MSRHRLTLHAAMAAALVDSGGGWMNVDDIADVISGLDLYRRPKDGNSAEPFQVSLRARKYPQYFEGTDAKFTEIRLRLTRPL